MADPVVLAVDGNSLVHRSFHASAHTAATTSDGRPSWAVRGLLTQLVAAVDRFRPTAVVVGFDDPDRSHRREQWPDYKAHRLDKLDTLIEQLELAAELMRELGVAVVVPPGLEADDVLASVARHARQCGAATVVVTSDRDAFALIDATTSVLRIINGGVEASPLMTADRLMTLLGVRPDQYRDFAALRGDPSDNLSGVRGIGARHAARLLAEFGSAAAAFDDLDAVRARCGAGVASRLRSTGARETWSVNCLVMAMRDDLCMELDLAGGVGVLPLDRDAVAEVFARLNLRWSVASALRVLAAVEPDAPPPPALETVTDWWPTGRSVRKLPRLPARRPAAQQLSLFD